MYICILHACSTHGGVMIRKKCKILLEMELRMVESHQMSALTAKTSR